MTKNIEFLAKIGEEKILADLKKFPEDNLTQGIELHIKIKYMLDYNKPAYDEKFDKFRSMIDLAKILGIDVSESEKQFQKLISDYKKIITEYLHSPMEIKR
jgi:hypothetical protein